MPLPIQLQRYRLCHPASFAGDSCGLVGRSTVARFAQLMSKLLFSRIFYRCFDGDEHGQRYQRRRCYRTLSEYSGVRGIRCLSVLISFEI